MAIIEMRKYKIPASITLAQGILESGNGNSTLARKANNHFGIKCHKGWKGQKFYWDDDAPDECFRKYKKVEESFRDHSRFLRTRGRYSKLFKLKITDYKGWARGLQQAGYATNKQYSRLLIKIIEENKLYKYDNKKYQRKILKGKIIEEIDKDIIDEAGVSEATSQSPPKTYKESSINAFNRKIYTNNNVRFIFAKAGDTFTLIAQDLKIYAWQLPKYNDLDKKANLKEGQMIYIQKKKRKSSEKIHTVKRNETLHSVSQLYGIRLKLLCKKNGLTKNDIISVGQQLKLR
jgi:LysM repeat protein